MKCQGHRHDTTINSLLKYTYIITQVYIYEMFFILTVRFSFKFKANQIHEKFKELKYISFYWRKIIIARRDCEKRYFIIFIYDFVAFILT